MVGYLRSAIQYLTRVLGPWEMSQTPGWVWGRGTSSAAGVNVTEEDSLTLSGVFAAVSLLSRVVGTLPLHVYRRSGRDRTVADTHPAYRVLHTQANPEMTAAIARRTLDFHRLLWGNAYAEIQWTGNAQPAAIWPIEPWRVRPTRDTPDGTLYYLVDGTRKIAPADILHVPLISYDGVVGRSFVEYAFQSVGLSIATQNHAATYFGNGARPGGILTHPGNTSDAQRTELRKAWQQRHGGGNTHSTGILWGGWTYTPDTADDAAKAQLLEQRRFGIEEVARWFNIPPHLLRELSRSTFSNIEHQGIDFVTYSVGPTVEEYEQEYNRKLLAPPRLYCKHNVNGLLRGDSAARASYFSTLLAAGVYSINEVRELDDLNPINGGDEHFVPLNMQPLSRALEEPEPEPEPEPAPQPPAEPAPEDAPEEPEEETPDQQSAAAEVILRTTFERMAKVEANAIRRLAKDPSRFLPRLEEFYAKFQTTLSEAFAPAWIAVEHAKRYPALTPDEAAACWCKTSYAELLDMAGRATATNLHPSVEWWIDTQQQTRVHRYPVDTMEIRREDDASNSPV